MTSLVEELALLNTSDSFEIVVKEYDSEGVLQPVDFSAATKMELTIKDSVIEANTDSTVIDWSLGDGRIKFALGNEAIEPTISANAILRVFDALHPNGQTIAHPRLTNNLNISIIE